MHIKEEESILSLKMCCMCKIPDVSMYDLGAMLLWNGSVSWAVTMTVASRALQFSTKPTLQQPRTQAFLAQILSRSEIKSGRGRPGFEANYAG